jgi:hypothetical protein
VAGSCEHGREPSGCVKFWEICNRATGGFSRTQLHGVKCENTEEEG